MILLTSVNSSQKSNHHRESAIQALKAVLARRDLGFHQVVDRPDLWESCAKRSEEVRRVFKRLVVLGIGGSSLGGRTIQSALGRGLTNEVQFFENVDAVEFWRRVELLGGDLSDLHWAIISKSGSTLETLSQANLISEYLGSRGLSLARQCTVISEKKTNSLMSWAKSHDVPTLEVPLDVGGRFSVLTPVGIFPAEFMGLPGRGFQKGAQWALQQTELVAQLVSESLSSFDRGEAMTLFWTYCDGLQTLGLWFQQLWAESLGQAKTRDGKVAPRASTPLPLVGANDQHSILQQVMDGPRDKHVWFLRNRQSESWGPRVQKSIFSGLEFIEGKGMGEIFGAEARATAKALEQVGVSSLTLEIERLDAPTMGALFMTLQLVVASLGEVLNINAFDQPGVELGKRLAKGYLST